MSNVLDLSDADTSGFEPLPSGLYDCVVFEAAWAETKGREGSKLPAGTPMLKIQFKVIDPEFDNRRLFTQFVIPPDSYDKEKAAKMKGMLVRFLTALGYDEKKLTSGKFNLNLDDLQGRECVVVAGQDKDLVDPTQMTNVVKAIKPAGSKISSGDTSLL